MVILGIDPGLASTGFGAIDCGERGSAHMLAGGRDHISVLRCGHIKTSPGTHISGRLNQIHLDINRLVLELRPDLVAVENVFSVVRYPRAGILLGGVLGAVYISAHQNGVRTVEITPKEVKSALAGYGGAGKEQIKSAVKRLLNINSIKSAHAADALAVALAAYFRGHGPQPEGVHGPRRERKG